MSASADERDTAASEGRSRASSLESHDRQLRLWRMIIRSRYLSLLAVAVAGLALPEYTPNQRELSVALLLVAVPYNGIYDLLMRRTGILYPTLAFSDQVLAVALIAAAPDLLAPGLLFMLGITANTAVSFGRRVAVYSSFAGFVGVCAVTAILQPPQFIPVLATYAVLDAFVALSVGAVSEMERDLRWRYSELMSGIDAIVWEQLSRRPSTLYVNAEAERVLGYPPSMWEEPGFWSKVVHPDDQRELKRRYREAIRKGESREFDYRMIAADGRVVHVQDRMRVETDELGRAVRVRGVMLDTTGQAHAEAKANQFVNLVNGIKLALFVFDLSERDDDDSLTVLAINPEAARLVGVDPDRAIGMRFGDLFSGPALDLVAGSVADVVRTGDGFTLDEFRPHDRGRATRVFQAFAFPLPGNAVGFSLHDITDRTMAAEVLRRQALHDGLTGLPNRTLLNERLRGALKSSERSGDPVSLLIMDLDQFKEVNDALGHDHGDRLLIEMSRRLQKVLPEADTIARLGGDEFAVLLSQRADAESAEETAITVRHALEQPFQLGGISVQTNASIGIAVFPEHAGDAETLAQRADVAMYVAKRNGGGYALYAPEHDQSSVRRLALLGELRGAIADDQLVLFFQPSVDLDTGEVHSCEALVRWQHPEHGLMPPAEFIELAEVSGLIQPMTKWILDAALRQIRAWLDLGLHIRVGVNLSVRNLYDRDLVPWLSARLLESGVDASLLKLEVTESELMDDPLLAMEVLGKLKALGAATSIDDFGTGYSSLAYLKHLPIDELKIDKSFVGNMTTDPSDLTIVRSTIDLSHNLGLSVVAEGVEDGETLHRLAELRCDRAQGYFVSRPVPAEDFTRWVQDPQALNEVRSHLLVGVVEPAVD